jgi:hypothetical protein
MAPFSKSRERGMDALRPNGSITIWRNGAINTLQSAFVSGYELARLPQPS